jgi:hypothetical protein
MRFQGNAQITPFLIEQLVKDEDYLVLSGVRYPALVHAFYKSNGFQPAWINNANSPNRQLLFHDIGSAQNL